MLLFTTAFFACCVALGLSIDIPTRFDLPPIKPGTADETKPVMPSFIPPFTIDGQTYSLTPEILITDLVFFTKLDTSRNNVLDQTEINAAFDTIDTSDDGAIDRDEAVTFQAKVLLTAGDKNDDDQLSEAEFNALFQKMNIDRQGGLFAGEMYAYLKHNSYL